MRFGYDQCAAGREKKQTGNVRSSKVRADFQLSSTTFIMVVQATDFWDLDDHAKIRWLDRPWLRSILLKR
jgi:hypothetical protein